MTRTLLMVGLLSIAGTGTIQPPTLVSFPTQDGGTIYAHSYGFGAHAVVLGSNGCGAKESWGPQAQRLVAEGYKVLAIDFRGNGQSHGGPQSRADDYHLDILAAVRYLYLASTSVSVIGASSRAVREDTGAERVVDPRRRRARAAHLRDRSGRSPHARNPAVPLRGEPSEP